MTKLYYLRGALGDTRLLEEHLEPIKKLLSGDYITGNLEKLNGHNVYSYRLSDRARLLFAIHEFEGRPCLVVLDYLPTHDYHKSRFLRPGVLKNYLERQEADYSLIAKADFSPYTGTNKLPVFTLSGTADEVPELAVADYYQQRLITLNLEQQEAFSVSLPALVSGVAGSGKSCVALSLLTDYLSKHPRSKEDDQPLLYVSKSKALVDSMRRAWSELPVAQDVPPGQVLFMTYNELIDAEDVASHGFDLVGEKEFALWYARFLDVARRRARTTKTDFQELDASTVYQECRIASGYSQEAYQQLGAKQSSLKEQSQRVWLYETYKTYLSLLAEQHQLNPEFHLFRPKKPYGLVVTDEAQDLSPRQLLQLGECARGSIVFCMDSHQRLHDSHSVRPFLMEQLGIKEHSHIELHVSHRCPMRVVTAANEVIAFKHRLIGGLADKREPMRIDSSASEHHLGHVFVMTPDSVLNNTWLRAQVAQPHCAIVTSEEHFEEAQKYFDTSVLVFTPQTIKGLEYDVVIAWKLYNPSFMAKARQRNALLSESSHPTHRPKDGVGEEHFGPALNQIYTSYTRAKQVLIISEEPSRDNKLLLEPLRGLADSAAPSEGYLNQQSLSSDWEQQASKQLEVGNERLALTIFKSKLGKTEAQFRIFLDRHHQRPNAVVEESMGLRQELKSPGEEFKRPREEFKRPREEFKGQRKEFKRPREESESPLLLPSVSLPANKKSPPEPKGRSVGVSSISSTLATPKQCNVLQAKPFILSLEKNFTVRRLELTLNLCDRDIWLHHYKDDEQNKTVILADLLLKDEYWPIFTSLLVNKPELVLKTPIEAILAYLDKKLDQKKLEELKQLIDVKNRVVLSSSTSPGTLFSPLAVAVATNNIMLINQLHKLGANLNLPTTDGSTPAFIAAQMGQVEALRVLKELGANLDIPNKDGSTPAFMAAQQGHVEALRVLKALGANLDLPAVNGVTPAFIAAQQGQVKVLRVLKELGVNLDLSAMDGVTPAFIAAQMGQVEALRVLKALGANLDLPATDGATPAFFAAQQGQVESLRVLKALGANLDTPKKDGATPVFIAAQNGKVESVRLLIQLRVDLNLNFPADKAGLIDFSKNYSEEVQQRMQKFIDSHEDKAQIFVSPLEIAKIMGHKEIVSLLSVAMQKTTRSPIEEYRFFSPDVLPTITPLSTISSVAAP